LPIQFVGAASVCHPWRHAGGLGKLRQYEYSIGVYLRLHPEKSYELNARYYLRLASMGFLKETLVGIWRFHGAGVLNSTMRQLFYLGMAWRFFVRASNPHSVPKALAAPVDRASTE
jgi:hypothetical protein